MTKIEQVLNEIRSARKNRHLLKYAQNVAADKNHILHRHLNKYPPIPFEIKSKELNEIKEVDFSKPIVRHNWTPWEKIFYALLWKNGNLKSIHRIIDGIKAKLSGELQLPDSAVIFNNFGRHLVSRVEEPLADKYTIRAWQLIENSKISTLKTQKKADVENYRQWFKKILTSEKVTKYEDSRMLDSLFFSLGKTYSKLRK